LPKLKFKGASKLALTVKASLDAPPMVYALPNLFSTSNRFAHFASLKAYTPKNGLGMRAIKRYRRSLASVG
jgi:hypothetical protein